MPGSDWQFNPKRKRRPSKTNAERLRVVQAPPRTPSYKSPKPKWVRIQLMGRYFDTDAQLARFLGISLSTLYAWHAGTRKPCAAVMRLVGILERLEIEAEWLHAELIERAKQGSTH